MENTEQSSASAAPQGAGGAKEKIEKQARQLAYDTRYKVRQTMSQQSGSKADPAAVRKAYMAQLAKSPAAPPVKARAKQMLIGENFVDTDELISKNISSAMEKVFVQGIKKVEEEVIEEDKGEKTFKVRVTDKKTNNSYVRNATRDKIRELRANPNISSVEMTEYGEPTKSEKYKGKSTAAVKSGKGDEVSGKDTSIDLKKENYSLKSENFDGFLELVEKSKEEKRKGKITGEGVDNTKLVKVFPDDVKEGKVGAAVGGTLGNIAGKTIGGMVAGPVGHEVGKYVGGALGAGAMAKKGKKGRAAVGGAVGTLIPTGVGLGSGLGGALAASHELEGEESLDERVGGSGTLVRQGVKVGGKQGGRAVQQGTTAATQAGKAQVAKAQQGNKSKMVGSGRAEKIGATVGGLAGGLAGVAIPDGPAMVAGELAGGYVGAKVGGKIGRQVDKAGSAVKKAVVGEGTYDNTKFPDHDEKVKKLRDKLSKRGITDKKEQDQHPQIDEGNQRDPEGSKKDRTYSKQPDPSKDGFTGIGNMSIDDIKKMNARMKKEEVQEIDEVVGAALGALAANKFGLAATLGGAAPAISKVVGPQVAKAVTGKTAATALGAAGGEILDPLKKKKDKNPISAAAGGAVGSVVHSKLVGESKNTIKIVVEAPAKVPLKPTGNWLQDRWNEFVPPRESSNNPNVRSGLRQPGLLQKPALDALNNTAATINQPIKAISKGIETAKTVAKAAPVAAGLGAGIVAKGVVDKVMGTGKEKVKEDADYGDEKETEPGTVCFDGGAALPATIKPIGDPREIPTALNLIKNKWRAKGLKMSYEPKGDKIDEGLGTALGGAVGGSVGAGTVGAVTGKKGRKVKKAIGAGTGAAVGNALLPGPLGKAIGGYVGGKLTDNYQPEKDTIKDILTSPVVDEEKKPFPTKKVDRKLSSLDKKMASKPYGYKRSNEKNRSMKISGIKDAVERNEDPRKDTRGGAYERQGNPPHDHRSDFSDNRRTRTVKKAGV